MLDGLGWVIDGKEKATTWVSSAAFWVWNFY